MRALVWNGLQHFVVVLAIGSMGCASVPVIPNDVQLARAKQRESSLRELPPNSPPELRDTLQFLWDQEDRKYDAQRRTFQCPSNYGLFTQACAFDDLREDRLAELFGRLRKLRYSGRIADDLLLEKVRYLLLRANPRLLADTGTFHERFPLKDAPLDVLMSDGFNENERQVLREMQKDKSMQGSYQDRVGFFTRQLEKDYFWRCPAGVTQLRRATASLPADVDFQTLASALLDTRDQRVFPSLKEFPQLEAEARSETAEKPNCLRPLVFSELTRVLRKELASQTFKPSDPAPALVQALQPLDAQLSAEPDALLRDTYRWLLGLAQNNQTFDPGWLRAPSGGAPTLPSAIMALEKNAEAYFASPARERAASEWDALMQRAIERSWSGDPAADVPLVMAMRLLMRGEPVMKKTNLTQKLIERLQDPHALRASLMTIGPLVSARLEKTPRDALGALALGNRLVSSGASEDWGKRSAERLAARLAVERLSAGAPGSATRAVVSWLRSALDPQLSIEGPHADRVASCLESSGIRRTAAMPDVMAVKISFDAPTSRVVKSAGGKRTETYYLPDDERRLLERALKNELAEIERVEDYAAYVRGRATRLKVSDDKLRYGRETARDRNFDSSYRKVESAAGEARRWADAERERIRAELAELDEPRQRVVSFPPGERTVFDVKLTLRSEWAGGFDVLTFSNDYASEDAALKAQADFACSNARSLAKSLGLHRKAQLASASVATESDRLADAFIKTMRSDAFDKFLSSLSFQNP